jgi:hypothetical protein
MAIKAGTARSTAEGQLYCCHSAARLWHICTQILSLARTLPCFTSMVIPFQWAVPPFSTHIKACTAIIPRLVAGECPLPLFAKFGRDDSPIHPGHFRGTRVLNSVYVLPLVHRCSHLRFCGHFGEGPAVSSFLSEGCRVSLAASCVPYRLCVATSPRTQGPSSPIEKHSPLLFLAANMLIRSRTGPLPS